MDAVAKDIEEATPKQLDQHMLDNGFGIKRLKAVLDDAARGVRRFDNLTEDARRFFKSLSEQRIDFGRADLDVLFLVLKGYPRLCRGIINAT